MHGVGQTESAKPTLFEDTYSARFDSPTSAVSRSDGSETDRRASRRRRGIGAVAARLLITGLGMALVVGGGWAVAKYAGFFGTEEQVRQLTHTVSRGDLVVTVTQKGNVESASNIDIRCLVAGGGIIKNIVADGTIVKEGDQLVEIDSAAIDEQILQQKIGYEKARAIRDQAKNDLESAKIALREYVEGTFKKDQQLVDSQITVAEENLRSAQNTLQYTERMFRKAYVTPLQLEAQQFAVKRAQLDLETARTAKKVLEEFTFLKTKNTLETTVATAEAKASSEQTAFELEESKLKRLEMQKANCLIAAPQAGMVVYANDSNWFGGSDRPKIEEGATIREGQVILRVPDLTQMQVKVTVHESKVESLRANMPASIRIQNRKLTGFVTFIANQPEPSSRYSGDVKNYAAYVRIDGRPTDLKPGMTAEVEVLIQEKKNVLTVPVQCVIEQAGKLYCWRETPQGFEKTEVRLGLGDAKSVEVVAGLKENDVVLQNPPERSEGDFAAKDTKSQFGNGERKPDGEPAASVTGTGPAPGGRSGSNSGSNRSMDLMSFDKDKDGKVSKAEAPEQMQTFFGRMDADGDGFISAQEAAAARARRSSGGGNVPAGDGPGGPSRNGSGVGQGGGGPGI